MRIAITGGTGFVGSHLIRVALEAGHQLSALTRRPQPERHDIRWIEGNLETPPALLKLCEGADAVVHVAGLTNARDRRGFAVGNVDGTARMIDAARAAGVSRYIQVSSLSAREPALSDYGWSKAEADDLVRASGLDWVIVRPPAVYGPGDQEMLELFKMAKRGIVMLPPGGRLSLIHGEDLARLLLVLATTSRASESVLEPDDGVPTGWSHVDFGKALGQAVGRGRVMTLATPAAMMHVTSMIDGWVRGPRAKLTRDRARYFCHPDWVIGEGARPPADLWRPQIETRRGLTETADAYRKAGWL